MPTFCRHNRLIQNCPICSREQDVDLRPIVSSRAPRTSPPRETASTAPRRRAKRAKTGGGAGVRVRRLARGSDDGFRTPLLPGLRSSADAERMSEELAFATARLKALADQPAGLYAEVADPGTDIEERTWLAFLIAYMCPLDGDDPFTSIRQARRSWASGEAPALHDLALGPRTAHEPARGTRTIDAYRTWAQRAGSQAAAFTGEEAWPGERRFARAFERLALPGLHRDARFDLLVTLGSLGVYDLRAGTLALGGDNRVTVAAKRAFGIGDPLLLERRALALAEGCGLPLAALDVALFNWERSERATLGLGTSGHPEPEVLGAVRSALGVHTPATERRS